MGKPTSFEAVIERGSEAVNSGYFVRVPPEVSEALGAKGQLRVVATIDGSEFRLSLAKYDGVHWLGLRAEVRGAIGKGPGDSIRVDLRPDLEPRILELPAELVAALDRDEAAKASFDRLSYSHRKEHAQYVDEAKRPETRVKRAGIVAEALKDEAAKKGR